jgi:hypothetical protein
MIANLVERIEIAALSGRRQVGHGIHLFIEHAVAECFDRIDIGLVSRQPHLEAAGVQSRRHVIETSCLRDHHAIPAEAPPEWTYRAFAVRR